MILRTATYSIVTTALLLLVDSARADEGMWLLNRPPTEQLKSKYGFEPSPGWLEHLQKSAVKIGASGSLVSSDGLLMTNHHVGSGQIQKLSTPDRDLMKYGFHARTRAEELKCPDMEVKILWSIDDITDRVNEAATPNMSPAAAFKARRARMTEIEQAEATKSGLDCEVVTLWNGARYHLYRYRKYTDVRLVFAPEKSVAFFGGDNDNFEYPRYDLDVTFFRIYENYQPLKPEHFLKWSSTGVAENELTFVIGHPGRTQRQLTTEHLRFLRDVDLPATLNWQWRREVQLTTFHQRTAEFARISEGPLFGSQNSRKARTGGYRGLLDPRLLWTKAQSHKRIAQQLGPDQRSELDRAVEQVAVSLDEYAQFYRRYQAVAGGGSRTLGSSLFGYAATLIQLSEELPKASNERLREYRDTELDSVYRRLYSPAPIYEDLEIEQLASGLEFLAEMFGADDPLATAYSRIVPTTDGNAVVDDQSPRAMAAYIVRKCGLRDIETRRKLAEGGEAAILASEDPMIRLAALLNPEYRALRKHYEDSVEAPQREAYAKIVAARFEADGEQTYPDATGTLRLAYGAVAGYEEDGRKIPAFTTFAGMYERHRQRDGKVIQPAAANTAASGGPGGDEKSFPAGPFDLPARWIERRDRVNSNTPYNFVTTADIIGGNSGSPVVNRAGEVVGLIFDGNLQSLVWDFAYTDVQERAVALDVRAIIEALRNVYDANELADELLN